MKNFKNIFHLSDSQVIHLTEFGAKICENRGWLEYLKKLNEIVKEKVVEEKTEPKKSNKNWFAIFSIMAFTSLLIVYCFIIDKK